jgi:hypothetical protein
MAILDDVSGVDKVFRDGAARDKPRLVWVDQKGDKDTESKGKTFGEITSNQITSIRTSISTILAMAFDLFSLFLGT